MLSVQQLATMIDHTVLHPTATMQELQQGAEIAKQFSTASYCLKPFAVPEAVGWLTGTEVLVCTVIGFPHGNSAIEIKVLEAKLACEQGASEIDMVINIAKAIEGDWKYLEQEISAINNAVVSQGAILKVIFETDYLSDEQIIRLSRIAAAINVGFIKTSTGFGFVKQPDGNLASKGATIHHLQLMRANSSATMGIKASGGIRTLDDALAAIDAGATRIGASASKAILEEAANRFG